ncbi:hypothetical protein SFRURICE_007438 [Spodoptera frugiperda]|nr:hypothetical protein SFRURICE_007438 [Spodoptera frugiperda]
MQNAIKRRQNLTMSPPNEIYSSPRQEWLPKNDDAATSRVRYWFRPWCEGVSSFCEAVLLSKEEAGRRRERSSNFLTPTRRERHSGRRGSRDQTTTDRGLIRNCGLPGLWLKNYPLKTRVKGVSKHSAAFKRGCRARLAALCLDDYRARQPRATCRARRSPRTVLVSPHTGHTRQPQAPRQELRNGHKSS